MAEFEDLLNQEFAPQKPSADFQTLMGEQFPSPQPAQADIGFSALLESQFPAQQPVQEVAPQPAEVPTISSPLSQSMGAGPSGFEIPEVSTTRVKEDRDNIAKTAIDIIGSQQEVRKGVARGAQQTLRAVGSGIEAVGDYIDNVGSNLRQTFYQSPLGERIIEKRRKEFIASGGRIEDTLRATPKSAGDKISEFGKFVHDFWSEAASTGWEKRDPKVFAGSFTDNPSFSRLAGTTGEAVPTMLGAIGLSYAGMPNAGAVLLAGSEALPVYTEAKEAGASEGDAFSYAMLSGIGTAALERVGLDAITGKNPLIDRLIGKMGRNWVSGALVNYAAEGSQEALQEMYQNAVALGYDEDRNVFEGALEAGITGGFLGVIGGAGARQHIADTMQDLAKSAETAINETSDAVSEAQQEQVITTPEGRPVTVTTEPQITTPEGAPVTVEQPTDLAEQPQEALAPEPEAVPSPPAESVTPEPDAEVVQQPIEEAPSEAAKTLEGAVEQEKKDGGIVEFSRAEEMREQAKALAELSHGDDATAMELIGKLGGELRSIINEFEAEHGVVPTAEDLIWILGVHHHLDPHNVQALLDDTFGIDDVAEMQKDIAEEPVTVEESTIPEERADVEIPVEDYVAEEVITEPEPDVQTYRTIKEAREATGATRNRIKGEPGAWFVRERAVEEVQPAEVTAEDVTALPELDERQQQLATRLEGIDEDAEVEKLAKELGISIFDGNVRKDRTRLEEDILGAPAEKVEELTTAEAEQESFLDRIEREAREEIELLKSGRVAGMGAPAGIAANYVVIGAVKIAKGVQKFSQWSAEMINEFGEEIRPYLDSIYKSAKRVYDQNADNPEGFVQNAQTEVDRLEERNLSLMSEDEDVRKLFADVDRARQKLGEPDEQTFEQWNNQAQKIYNESPEGAYLSVVSGELDMANPVNVMLAKKAMTEYGKRDLNSGDQADVERAITAAYEVRRQGTEVARALAARRDPSQTPAERVQTLLEQSILNPTQSELRTLETVSDKRRMTLIKKQAKRAKDTLDELQRNGINISDIGELDGLDKRKVASALRIIQAQRATGFDKEFEFWRNAVLSAPSTQISNIIGNTFNSFYEYAVLKPTEAALNTMTGGRVKGATTMADLRSIYKGIFSSRAWADGWRNAVDAFINEQPVVEGTKLEGSGVAIGGQKGRLIRTPQRLLLAADEFAKGTIMQIEVAAQAAMLGRQQGLDGDALDAFVEQQVNDHESTAWGNALDVARDVTFQSKVGPIARNLMKTRNADGVTGFFARHTIPFVVTPANIVKTGIRRTPLGSLALPSTLVKAVRGEVSQQQAMTRVAEQFIAWGLAAVLAGLVNDTDDDGLPKWLTGSSPTPTERGEREFQYRNVPAQSIRMPGSDRWVSYSRIEPMATTLSTMVDLMQKDGEDMSQKTWQTLTGLARDKTFLQGISDVIDVVEKRDLNAVADWSSNFAASYVPNIVRNSLRSEDDLVRQYMVEDPDNQWQDIAKRTAQRAFPHKALMPPAKVDLFGRDVEKASATGWPLTDFIYNATMPIRLQDKEPVQNVDRFLINYNNKFPDNQYWPIPPSPTYRSGGESLRMDEDQYHQFLQLRGEYISERQGRINADNPTPEQKERLQKLFSEATVFAKRQMGIQTGSSRRSRGGRSRR